MLHAGGEFARREKRVLMIDCDPQGSLSQVFFGSEGWEQLRPENTLAKLFDDVLYTMETPIIYKTGHEKIRVVPSHQLLREFNSGRPSDTPHLQEAIAGFLNEYQSEFDVVLIDTPPNLQLLTWAAMACPNAAVITPVIPEDFASQGIVHVKRFIEQVRDEMNPDLSWLGIVLSMAQKRLGVHQAYEQQIREAYADVVLDTTIPAASVFKEAVSSRVPITLYKPRTPGAKAIESLVTEIETRMAPAEERKAA